MHVKSNIGSSFFLVPSISTTCSCSLGDAMFLRAFMPWLHLDSTFALSSLGRKQKKCLKVLHGMTKRVIRSRKEQILNKIETESQQDELGSTGNGKVISDPSSEVVGSNQTLYTLSRNVIVKPILTSQTSLEHTILCFKCIRYDEYRMQLGLRIYLFRPYTV
jgi:hypothetical protein